MVPGDSMLRSWPRRRDRPHRRDPEPALHAARCTLRERDGLTYLMVTHDLGAVAHLCERVAVMQQGRIVEEVAVDALCRGEVQHAYTRLLLGASESKVLAVAEGA